MGGTVDMMFLVTYDIPEPHDYLRAKLARLLKDYGLSRLQKSVFMGRMSRNMVENLAIEIQDLLEGIDADVRIFPLCRKCLEHAITVMEGREMEWMREQEAIIIA